MTATHATPTIARIWRGRVARERADEYAAYLYEHGIRPLEEKALAVQQLREDRAADPRRIHHLPRDPEFLIELPQSVQVLAITSSKGLFGG